jgi:anti-sigma28 factor (negative regulator of flagellin synthesis)
MQTYRWGSRELMVVDQERTERAAENDVQRANRVMELRAAIRAGRYSVPAADLADRMLESLPWP